MDTNFPVPEHHSPDEVPHTNGSYRIAAINVNSIAKKQKKI